MEKRTEEMHCNLCSQLSSSDSGDGNMSRRVCHSHRVSGGVRSVHPNTEHILEENYTKKILKKKSMKRKICLGKHMFPSTTRRSSASAVDVWTWKNIFSKIIEKLRGGVGWGGGSQGAKVTEIKKL